MLSVHPIIILLLLLIVLLNHNQTVWAQQLSFGQDPFENTTSSEIQNRLDTIIELLQQARQGSIIQPKSDHYCIHDGIGICNLWTVHWTGTKTFCLYEETLSDCLLCTYCSYHSHTRTIYSYALLSGAFEDPVLTVAFLLLIPVTASYVLMIVKSRHEFVQRS